MGFSPVVITGIVPNPPGGDTQWEAGEFVVLENLSNAAISIGGWRLRDKKKTFVVPRGTVMLPHGRLQLHTGRGTSGPTKVFFQKRQATWNNPGDIAELCDPSGKVLQRFSYGGG